MTVSTDIACPPIAEGEPPFSSLGAIDRIGIEFCESAQNLQRIADLQQYRSFRMRCLSTTLTMVEACGIPERAAVSVRLKRLDSIRRKIGRADTDFRLGRLDDVIGVRIICEDLRTVRDFSERIRSSPEFHNARDYIAKPAPSGYRGINHVMRFQQPVTDALAINMRFEVQTRTYLQHCWAVWSESHGEAVKLGVGEEEIHGQLRGVSEKIGEWENENPATVQMDLPDYSGGSSIVVCWRMSHGPPMTHHFLDQVQRAVDHLSFLETNHPAERNNAILLVGVASAVHTGKLLRLTHPLFSGVAVPDPEYWMPAGSC